jgi:ABC-type lipoprotein release transport system permease subunit
VAESGPAELVFVVDVSSFTNKGFIGTSTYGGKKVDIRFDDAGAGVFLTSEMAARLHVKKGSKVSLTLEEGSNQVVEIPVAGLAKAVRVSDPKVYYAVGREGGAVMRLRKA